MGNKREIHKSRVLLTTTKTEHRIHLLADMTAFQVANVLERFVPGGAVLVDVADFRHQIDGRVDLVFEHTETSEP